MSQKQSQGLGGLTYKAAADYSGLVSDVTNGNPVGTTYKNGIGLAVVASATADVTFLLASSSTAPVLGVLQDNPRSGEAGSIQTARGTSAKILTGAAVTRGDRLMVDAYGRGITVTSGTKVVYAQAMESASGAGALIEAVLMDNYVA